MDTTSIMFSLFKFVQDNKWTAQEVIAVPPKIVSGWALPEMPSIFVTNL